MFPTILTILLIPSFVCSRRLLHEPLVPQSQAISPLNHFFPKYHTPTPHSSVLSTIPANISSLLLPNPPSKTFQNPKHKTLLALSITLFSVSLFSVLAFLVYFRTHITPKLVPFTVKIPRFNRPRTVSTEFLCPRDDNLTVKSGSPEIYPLPPLPRKPQIHHMGVPDYDYEDVFFSPRDSPNFEVSENVEPENPFPNSFPVNFPPPPPGPPVLRVLGPLVAAGTTRGKSEEMGERVKLKPLHWDKVRASSGREMVWDHLGSTSFQLNEEMIETLFTINGSNLNQNNHLKSPLVRSDNRENRVLDPKKSQNIAILLRALNVTADEVCEALLEGNADCLGAELLESLLKMAPTKDEERKLKAYVDESPIKLGPAEKFLKAVIDVPFAFLRMDALLFIANFDSEVEYIKKSFETLEAACGELKQSKMFLKLLEAVLKTGNRMNVGTNRGDAMAFKLETLLKLVDIKGTDGKTTLLHFVVQEIVRSEGSRLSGDQNKNRPIFRDDAEFKKLGLQVVSGLSGELLDVKKASVMDVKMLCSDVAKLAMGIPKIGEVLKLGEGKFSESMSVFLNKAEEEIDRVQAQQNETLTMVTEVTEYFDGNSDSAHPLRIFKVVSDFLLILDHVCKDVGMVNERTIIGSGRQFPQPVNPA